MDQALKIAAIAMYLILIAKLLRKSYWIEFPFFTLSAILTCSYFALWGGTGSYPAIYWTMMPIVAVSQLFASMGISWRIWNRLDRNEVPWVYMATAALGVLLPILAVLEDATVQPNIATEHGQTLAIQYGLRLATLAVAVIPSIYWWARPTAPFGGVEIRLARHSLLWTILCLSRVITTAMAARIRDLWDWYYLMFFGASLELILLGGWIWWAFRHHPPRSRASVLSRVT